MTSAKSIHVRRLEDRVTRTAARLTDHATRNGLDVAEMARVKLPWYEVRNQAGSDPATVLIYEEIGGSLGVTADQFARDLEQIDAPVIHVRINSPGGSLFDGIAIHNTLLHHPARIVVYVDSLAASAASIIAMAGDEVVMMPGSQMMIHDASALEEGNAADHSKMATFLDRQSENIADFYMRRGGGDRTEWRELMLAETWMFADEAVTAGLADRVQSRAEPTADPEGLMTRSFDLARYGYRHAGRGDAPAPARRRNAETARPAPSVRPAPLDSRSGKIRARVSSDAERRSAAQQRAGAAAGRPLPLARRDAPAGISAARSVAFPSRLTAKLVQHNGQDRYHVFGHASVVDTPYEMWDAHGAYWEVIDAGAFTRTLAAGPDVAFLVNHRGVTMARTTNGSLTLEMDDVGLFVNAWLNPKRQDVTDLVTAIEDGDIDEMSFAFLLGEGGGRWSADYQTFTVTEADINRGDVSAVNYGANPYTDVAARSQEILSDLDRLPTGAARAAVARLQTRLDIGAASVADREAELMLPAEMADEPSGPPAGRSLAHVAALLDI